MDGINHGLVLDTHGHIRSGSCYQHHTRTHTRHINHMKTVILIILFFTVPGVIMGLVSSYRAGQKPIGDLYLRIKKFAQQKFRG